MSRARREAIIAPLVTLFTLAVIFLVDRAYASIPNPVPLLALAVLFSAYLGGIGSGLFSAALTVAFACWFFADEGGFLRYSPNHLNRLVALVITSVSIAITVGWLRVRADRAFSSEHEARQEIEANNKDLMTLRAALDRVDYGIVLLDQEMRAQFINRAFRKMWKLSDEKADSKPPFVALMYHGRDTGAYAVPLAELDAYVAQRTKFVKDGNETLLDLRRTDGSTLRFHCTRLPDGGRMLSYLDVTDLIDQSEKLERLARTDSLTGLYNRRHFLTLAAAEWDRFKRYGQPLSLLMIDIDHFKAVNDSYGHDIGDRVIAQIADCCRDARRASDIAARLGGEEFAVLLPETPADAAVVVAERLQRLISAKYMKLSNGEKLRVTLSIGVAAADAEMHGLDHLIKHADHALYGAKRSGRNRVVVAPPVETQETSAA